MAKKLRLMWLWLAWLWMGVRGFKDPLAAFLNCMRRSLWSHTQHNHYQHPSLVIEEATLSVSLSTKLLPFHIGQRLPPHRICQNHSVGPQCRSGKVIKRCEFFIDLLFSYLATGVPVLMWATVLQRHYESFFNDCNVWKVLNADVEDVYSVQWFCSKNVSSSVFIMLTMLAFGPKQNPSSVLAQLLNFKDNPLKYKFGAI